MSTDTVPVQSEVVEEAVVQPEIQEEQIEESAPVEEQAKEERVPLSALQKERKKRQEVEQELRWHKEQMMQAKAAPDPDPDESLYETVTKEDLGKFKQQIVRDVAESAWIKANPDKAADINEKLTEFLKQRPNLASAIEAAPNRYEEAWDLMDKLSPRQKLTLKNAPAKKDAPGSPAAVPKAANINQAVDLSQMTDAEFNAWRQSQRKRR